MTIRIDVRESFAKIVADADQEARRNCLRAAYYCAKLTKQACSARSVGPATFGAFPRVKTGRFRASVDARESQEGADVTAGVSYARPLEDKGHEHITRVFRENQTEIARIAGGG